MRKLAVTIATLGATLGLAAPASAYLHVGTCIEGLSGANGDNEIAQTRPFDVRGVWRIDILEYSRDGNNHVVADWRWVDGLGGGFWFAGECFGNDGAYIDRLIGPG